MKIGISVKLGIIAGLINCIAWFTFAKQLGYYTIEVYVYRNYVTLSVLVIGVFLTVFLTRKNKNGFLEFKEGLKAGVLYSLILALTLAIFNYIYYAFITPDTIDYFLSEAKRAAIAHKLTDVEIDKVLKEEKGNFSSFKLIPPVIFFGLISSLIASAVFQRKNTNSSGFSAN